ncbi:hypothetical protein KAI31_02260, partial [Candidatus Bathyarchaeota archaeon]|nr:hypothetical protein [Candidatus Bathyarchaeota archaeon]
IGTRMKYLNYKLSNEPSKIVEDATLLKNERCSVDALRGTLALPILIDEKVQDMFSTGQVNSW